MYKLNDILIISKTDSKDYSTEKSKVVFIIGGVGVRAIDDKLVELLKKQEYLKADDILFKYNGVELNISTQNIPNIVNMLSTNNISIYGIYKVYNPKIWKE